MKTTISTLAALACLIPCSAGAAPGDSLVPAAGVALERSIDGRHARSRDDAIGVLRATTEVLGGTLRELGDGVLLRVPLSERDRAEEMITRLLDVESTSSSRRDLGPQLEDLELRLEDALRVRERLRSLIGEASTAEEVRALDAQLAAVRREVAELRSERGSLRVRIRTVAYRIGLAPMAPTRTASAGCDCVGIALSVPPLERTLAERARAARYIPTF